MGIAFGFREIAPNTSAFSAPRLVDLAVSADGWKSGVPRRAVRVYEDDGVEDRARDVAPFQHLEYKWLRLHGARAARRARYRHVEAARRSSVAAWRRVDAEAQ
jgi:ribosome modulation factor